VTVAPEPAPAAPERPRVASPLPLYEPLWTYVLLGLNGLVWLAMTLAGGSEEIEVLVQFGAKFNPYIALRGEYWRLVTPMFLHIGLMHLAFNSYALLAFGRDVENLFGRSRFLALYLLSGVGGAVASFVGNDAISAGASGAVFGLVGAMLVFLLVYRNVFGQWGRQRLTNLLFIVALNLALGFAGGGIDNLGHIGGLLAGLALGWAYCPRYRPAPPEAPWDAPRLVDGFSRGRAWFASFALLAALVALAYLGTLRWTAIYSGLGGL
jgi:rhomboid protease GluP